MMRVLAVILLATMLGGCVGKTEYGRCVGINGHEDPTLIYEYSAWNISIGIIFIEMIIPPIYVVLDRLKCPVAKIDPAAKGPRP